MPLRTNSARAFLPDKSFLYVILTRFPPRRVLGWSGSTASLEAIATGPFQSVSSVSLVLINDRPGGLALFAV